MVWSIHVQFAKHNNGTPLQYSCLGSPMDGGAWWATVHGVSNSTERHHFHFSLSCTGEENGNPLQYCCLENPRDRSLVGCHLWGRTESDTTDMTQQHSETQSKSVGHKISNLNNLPHEYGQILPQFKFISSEDRTKVLTCPEIAHFHEVIMNLYLLPLLCTTTAHQPKSNR